MFKTFKAFEKYTPGKCEFRLIYPEDGD